MPLTARALDRTLLARQHLLERTDATPLAMVEHLVGLQAQDNLPPYLSLAGRLQTFDPRTLSDHLVRRTAVRFFTMRGTIHVLTAADALALRPWVQGFLDRSLTSNQQARPAVHLTREQVSEVVGDVLAGGAASVADIREHLARAFPETPSDAALQVARQRLPLVQAPPRGLWRRSGGVVYAHVEDWLGAPQTELDLPALVRRWLAAYGPATAADLTTWSSVTRLGPVFKEMASTGELVELEGPDGKVRYDVPGGVIVDEDTPAPVRLLGTYDNVWLSHASRDRVAPPEMRRRWMGANGGTGRVLMADGAMAGQWKVEDGRVVADPWRRLTRTEKAELAEESARVETLLAVPPFDD